MPISDGPEIPIEAESGGTSIFCPMCGGENAPDAVFCANQACHKALGEFRYLIEELDAETTWHERIADRVTGFIGKPHFLAAHALWVFLWVAVNTGIIGIIRMFDDYPFSLLGIVLSVETIFITGFILISSNRESRHSDKLAELDYEVSVRTYREIQRIDGNLTDLIGRLNRIERALSDLRKDP